MIIIVAGHVIGTPSERSKGRASTPRPYSRSYALEAKLVSVHSWMAGARKRDRHNPGCYQEDVRLRTKPGARRPNREKGSPPQGAMMLASTVPAGQVISIWRPSGPWNMTHPYCRGELSKFVFSRSPSVGVGLVGSTFLTPTGGLLFYAV